MARPAKKGLDYFPLDVNFLKDLKVRKIMRSCGSNSIPILISLLCNIYKDDGYYVEWDSDISFLTADEVGVSEGSVDEVVKKALKVGFFNQTMFNEHKILTSQGIQERFIKASERRKKAVVWDKYSLLPLSSGVNVYSNSDNEDINSVNDNRSTQSKVKESKEKNNKEQVPENKFSETHLQLAEKLRDSLMTEFPKEMQRAKTNQWANDIRLLNEKDEQSIEAIEYVLDWLPKHEFWFANIRSGKKLRDQFEKLKYEIKKGKSQTKNNYQKQTTRKETLPNWAENTAEVAEEPISEEEQAALMDRLNKIRSSGKEE